MYIIEERDPSGAWRPLQEFTTRDEAHTFCILLSQTAGGGYRILEENEVLETFESEGGLWVNSDENQHDKID